MQIINMNRGNGKTIMLIYAAYMTGSTIVCRDMVSESIIQDRAEKLGMTVSTITHQQLKRLKLTKTKLVIDDIDYYLDTIIKSYFESNEILSCTMSIPCIDRITKLERGDNNE